MQISVIVPTLNEELFIEECLKSVRLQKGVDFELIVCDARSDDRTPEIAKTYADKVISSNKRSVGLQRNEGAKKAVGDFLLFIDADTKLPPGFLKKAVTKFDDSSLAGFSASFRFTHRCSRMLFAEKTTNAYFEFRSKIGVATLPGFNTFVRKSAFEKLGGFRDIPLEDVDFGIRLRAIGRTCYFTDIHVVTSSRRLDQMGVLGTVKYYLEMDLSRTNPRLSYMLTYHDNFPCRIDASMLRKEYDLRAFGTKGQEFETHMLDYIDQQFRTKSKKLKQDLVVLSSSISELRSKTRVDKLDVDRAVNLIRRKLREEEELAMGAITKLRKTSRNKRPQINTKKS